LFKCLLHFNFIIIIWEACCETSKRFFFGAVNMSRVRYWILQFFYMKYLFFNLIRIIIIVIIMIIRHTARRLESITINHIMRRQGVFFSLNKNLNKNMSRIIYKTLQLNKNISK
jgi:hypothetical protein